MGYKLDKYQTDAIKSEDRNALIVAAPGSGKTTVIINKVDDLVSNKNIDFYKSSSSKYEEKI